MAKISETTHTQLFYLLLKVRSNTNISKPTKEDIQYATNLIYAINYFKPDVFKTNFEYDAENQRLTSKQVKNAFLFMTVDYDGIINEIASQSGEVFDEVSGFHFVSDTLTSFDIKDEDVLNNLAITLYFKDKYKVDTFTDCKKELVKDKLDNSVDLEMLKTNFQKLINDLKK